LLSPTYPSFVSHTELDRTDPCRTEVSIVHDEVLLPLTFPRCEQQSTASTTAEGVDEVKRVSMDVEQAPFDIIDVDTAVYGNYHVSLSSDFFFRMAAACESEINMDHKQKTMSLRHNREQSITHITCYGAEETTTTRSVTVKSKSGSFTYSIPL